ncbi:hypothetical protein GCM10027343_15580 [Noviherbaspirillum agri]
MNSIRSKNLILARSLFGGMLRGVTEALDSVINQTTLIKMGQGEKEITDSMARRIEQLLGLPINWMDRDNERLLRMSLLDYEVYEQISLMPESAKKALGAFLTCQRMSA